MRMKRRESHTILLIDDKKDLAMNIGDILEDNGYDISIANNGNQAIKLLSKKKFSIAIVDLKLPDIFGLDLIDKLSVISPELEYIIITGHGKMEDAATAVSSKKILAFEFKPVDIPRLLKLLDGIFRRKFLEKALRDSEEKYRTLIERSLVGIYITQDHILKFCNSQFKKIFGYGDDEELTGRHVSDLVYSEDWEIVDSEVNARIKGEKKSSRYEFRGIRKNGSVIYLEVLGSLVNFEGKPAIQGSIIDITKRIIAEENARKLSAAVENNPMSIVITDAFGNIEYINKKFLDLTGYKEPEVLDKNPRILQSGETSLETYNILWKTITSGKIWNGEFRNKKKGGELYWESASIGPIKDPGGRITHYVGLKEDITEKKEIEEELTKYRNNLESLVNERTSKLEKITENLRKSEKSLLYLVEDVNESKREVEETNKKLKRMLKQVEDSRNRVDAILKSLADGIIVIDLRKEIIMINRFAEFLFNVISDAVLGGKINSVIKAKNLRMKFKKVLSDSPSDHRFEFDIKMDDSNEMKTIEVRVAVIWDKFGIVNGQVLIFRDMTHEKEIDRMKSEFISTSAHELRTPLTTIRGYSELLSMRSDLSEAEKIKFLGYINTQAVRLGEIISNLLDISRIESGKGLKIKKEKSDINKLIRESIEQYKPFYKKHNFIFNLYSGNNKAQFDPSLITQVLINLISNSLKYSPRGGDIKVTTAIKNKSLHCTISDQGIGMTKKELDKIFDKFYRVDSSNTAIEGSGLGMNIVKHIIEEHNGNIEVISVPKKGTTVNFSLPVLNNSGKKIEGGVNEKDINS